MEVNNPTSGGGGGGGSFSSITSGTNTTAAMVVGSGASFTNNGPSLAQGVVVANSGSAYTINQANGTQFDITLTAATPVLTLAAVTASESQRLPVTLIQDGTGGRLPSFVNVTWAAGVAPTVSSAIASSTYLEFISDGVTWTGYAVPQSTGTGPVVQQTSPTLLGNPIAPTQASTDNSTNIATTAYVTTGISNAISGVNPAIAVSAATTVAGNTSTWTYSNGVSGVGATFTGPVNTAITIDGILFNTITTQSLLVKNDTQSPSGAFNGIYVFTTAQTGITGAIFTRRLDYDTPSDINNTGAIPVVGGTVNALTSWLLTSNVATVGTSPLTYTQFSVNPTTVLTTANTVTVPQGGTGVATATAYSVVCAGTTSTGAFQPLAALGASGTVLTSNGPSALPSFQAAGSGGWTLIASTAASNSTSIDFLTGFSSSYKTIVFLVRSLVPASTASMQMLVSIDGSTFKNGSNNYTYTASGTVIGVATQIITNSTGNTRIVLSTLDNITAAFPYSGNIQLADPSNAAIPKIIDFSSAYYADSPKAPGKESGGGWYKGTGTDVSPILGARFFMAAGNITSGTIEQWGIA